MVCVAAFIILCLVGIFVLILSIWMPKLGKRYWLIFKKAWGCVGKRITLQKCDTNFKADIKNSILKKFIIKKPKLVKPISFGIEVVAVIIVAITIFSLVETVKGGLALYILGTCNVSRPESCVFVEGDVCPVDLGKTNWFQDWVILFQSIPDRIKDWDAKDYVDGKSIFYREYDPSKDTVLNIFEPMCHNCATSFGNQLEKGFFEKYNVALIPYSTKGNISNYITAVILAAHEEPLDSEISPSWLIIKQLFQGEYKDGISWQNAFITDLVSESDLEEIVRDWLEEIGYNPCQIEFIISSASSPEMIAKKNSAKDFVDENIRIRGVPTTIYNGRRNTGVIK